MPSTKTLPFIMTTKCCDCGVEKHFTKEGVAQGRHENPRCRLCGLRFYWSKQTKRTKEEKTLYHRQYYQRNKLRLDEFSNTWNANKRLEFIKLAGGKCVQCGEDDPIVLDFDHVHDDGAEHRRETNRKKVVHILSKTLFEQGRFQLLCKNCNWRKEHARRKNAKRQSKAA